LQRFFTNARENSKKQESDSTSESVGNNKTNITKDTERNLEELQKELTLEELKTISIAEFLKIKLEDRLKYVTKNSVDYHKIAD
jgi:hypothetical protein